MATIFEINSIELRGEAKPKMSQWVTIVECYKSILEFQFHVAHDLLYVYRWMCPLLAKRAYLLKSFSVYHVVAWCSSCTANMTTGIGIQPSISRPTKRMETVTFCRLWKWLESKSCVRKNRVRLQQRVEIEIDGRKFATWVHMEEELVAPPPLFFYVYLWDACNFLP